MLLARRDYLLSSKITTLSMPLGFVVMSALERRAGADDFCGTGVLLITRCHAGAADDFFGNGSAASRPATGASASRLISALRRAGLISMPPLTPVLPARRARRPRLRCLIGLC